MADDLLIVNGIVKTGTAEENLLSGYVAVGSGLIREVGEMAALPASVIRAAAKVIDATGCLVMPGLVNGHNHGAMTLFRGLADDLPLIQWLQEHIFPSEATFVNSEMVYWCTRLAAAEMILSGTTTVADGYFYEEQAARAFKESGMRAVVAQGVIDFPAPGVPDPSANLHLPAALIKAWHSDNLIRPAIFCHSPYTCSPVTIKGAKQLAREAGVQFFIHLAESAWEVEEIQRRHGLTPLRHLHELGILDEATVCVHSVWLDRAEIELLSSCGTGVITCPESNMKLASGAAPVARMLTAGIPVGLGTDGSASNNDLDLFGEMRTTALLHKLIGQDPTLLPTAEVVGMATVGGARVLGLQGSIGELLPGKKADLIVVDLQKPHLTPHYDTDSLLTYAAVGSDVKTSIIDGVLVMEERRLLTIDLKETMARVRSLARQVRTAF
jgi:5-methylthioadenosine/S-adenosylhomocysteine deaminase